MTTPPPTYPPRISVTGGDDDVFVHCTCGWYTSVPAGTAWGEFAWQVGQHSDMHRQARRQLADTAQERER